MAADPKKGGVSAVLLERYLAGDLPEDRRRQIEAACVSDPGLGAELARLREENRAFLSADPPEAFAHRLAVQLEVEGVRAKPAGRRWAFILAPSAAAAVTVVLVLAVNETHRPPVAEAPAVPALAASSASEDVVSASPADENRVASPPPTLSVEQSSSQRRKVAPKGAAGAVRLVRDREAKVSELDGVPRATAELGEAAPVAPTAGPPAVAEPLLASPPAPARAAPVAKAKGEAAPMADKTRGKRRSRSDSPAQSEASSSVGGVRDEAARDDGSGVVDRAAVLAAVREVRPRLAACLRVAKDAGEIAAGRYTATVSWIIETDGTVRAATVVAPADWRRLELGRCVTRELQRMRFSRLTVSVPVRNVPIGPMVVE